MATPASGGTPDIGNSWRPSAKLGGMWRARDARSGRDVLPYRVEAVRTGYSATRQGDLSRQLFNASLAHTVVLSVWQEVQGLGILYCSVFEGGMNSNV